jgi:hypothetical protein
MQRKTLIAPQPPGVGIVATGLTKMTLSVVMMTHVLQMMRLRSDEHVDLTIPTAAGAACIILGRGNVCVS